MNKTAALHYTIEEISSMASRCLINTVNTTPDYYIGPFTQVLTLKDLPIRGTLQDEQLDIVSHAGLWIKDQIIHAIFPWQDLSSYLLQNRHTEPVVIEVEGDYILTPGLIDAHTHLCYAGTRAQDYADRLNGVSYQQIMKRGGGIKDSMRATRQASSETLQALNLKRLAQHLRRGVTTVEIKSGYGLSVTDELKQLESIQAMQKQTAQSLIATCLAAHVLPPEFNRVDEYLQHILHELLPQVKARHLSQRVDIFVEPNAFPVVQARDYLLEARRLGFELCVHADQFVPGGVRLAAELNARSADHLEASQVSDLQVLAQSDCVPIALPGASLGLGCDFTPARKILDMGMSLAIASDWNPGSAPMGHLLLQASVLGTQQKLSAAEVWAGMCTRAAYALGLQRVGAIMPNYQADLLMFETSDYREVLYQQGMLLPQFVACKGQWFTF